jgi:ankyrin repeat protein
MRAKLAHRILVGALLICTLTDIGQEKTQGCTIGVASGKATADGRPLLWTNCDERTKNYEVVYLKDGRFKHLGVVVPDDSKYFGAGVNEFGFCIVDSLAFNLTYKSKKGIGNMGLMRLALRQCVTADDFENLLKQTNVSGRTTADNFGVIDAFGGAAIFETGNFSYTRFDATDPKVAPQGYIIRANFALTGRTDGDFGRTRYDRANQLWRQAVENNGLDYRYVLRKVCRDFSVVEKVSYSRPEMNVTEKGDLEVLDTENSISNHSTNWVALFHGVRPDENPSLTTFWAIIGDPILSVAVPSWVIAESTAPELDGVELSPVCTAAGDLRQANYVMGKGGKPLLSPDMLPDIWAVTYPAEDRILNQTESIMTQWRQDYPTAQQVSSFHRSVAFEAMSLLQKVTELLIQKGGATAHFRIALYMRDLEKARAFIEQGININVLDGHGYAPLHYAAKEGNKEIVELLISHGADVSTKGNQGRTPIDLAMEGAHREIVKLLLSKSGDVSIHMEAYIGDLQRVEKFIYDGTDVDAEDHQGQTSLHYAAKAGEIGVLEFLLAKGADVNAKNNRSFTPLFEAVRGKHKDVVALFIGNGANVNAKARWDYTPIYYAAWSGNTEMVELLVEEGADVNAKDEWGWTPLHYMVQDNLRDMAEFLIAKDADVNAKDNEGITPLQVAKDKGHTEIVKLLRKHGAKE